LTSDESDVIAKYLRDVLLHSPEIQCRIRWNPNDLAIWDNHSVYHAATKCNVSEGNQRTGFRAVCLAERPYLDPESKSRAEDLKEQGLTV
jgi:alpha-ketoglutarate-dependent taurine dioxygenase